MIKPLDGKGVSTSVAPDLTLIKSMLQHHPALTPACAGKNIMLLVLILNHGIVLCT